MAIVITISSTAVVPFGLQWRTRHVHLPSAAACAWAHAEGSRGFPAAPSATRHPPQAPRPRSGKSPRPRRKPRGWRAPLHAVHTRARGGIACSGMHRDGMQWHAPGWYAVACTGRACSAHAHRDGSIRPRSFPARNGESSCPAMCTLSPSRVTATRNCSLGRGRAERGMRWEEWKMGWGSAQCTGKVVRGGWAEAGVGRRRRAIPHLVVGEVLPRFER